MALTLINRKIRWFFYHCGIKSNGVAFNGSASLDLLFIISAPRVSFLEARQSRDLLKIHGIASRRASLAVAMTER